MRATADRVVVVKSTDLGRTFSAPVAVTPEPMNLDWGPDARARIAVDPKGGLVVTFAIFQDKNFNGRAFFARSSDGGASFTQPQPITADTTSQRFETRRSIPTAACSPPGSTSATCAKARAAGRPYPGAALAYAWSRRRRRAASATPASPSTTPANAAASASPSPAPGRPAVVFRNIFAGSVRDHAVVTFQDPTTPGPLRRVSVDDWKIEACPHHGPSLAIAPDGSYHVAWFTDGAARKGLFYARADSADAPFGPPRALSSPDRQPARPYLLADGPSAASGVEGVRRREGRWCAGRSSHDSGRTWSAARTVAETADASDHPLLVARSAGRAYLSWLTKTEGYRLIPLEDQP